MRAAAVLAAAIMMAVPLKAQAAVTKSILLACKEEADLRMAAKLRTGGDRKASVDFETGKIKDGACLLMPRDSIVGIDQRKPPFICIRPSGGFDCYWTISSAVDEFLVRPPPPKSEPPPKSKQ